MFDLIPTPLSAALVLLCQLFCYEHPQTDNVSSNIHDHEYKVFTSRANFSSNGQYQGTRYASKHTWDSARKTRSSNHTCRQMGPPLWKAQVAFVWIFSEGAENFRDHFQACIAAVLSWRLQRQKGGAGRSDVGQAKFVGGRHNQQH
jgi:hypothetical protein